MAAIDTYTVDTVINDADKVIGTDSANSNVTANFRMDAISDYVISNIELSDITVVTAAELGILDGATLTTSELNTLDGVTATATEINVLDGLSATTAELNFVDGVTSAIQTQLDGKQSTITGAATTITSSDLTVSRALVSDTSGKVVVSTITATEVGHLDGVTSNIQTQLGNIVQFVPTNTGNANQVLVRTASGYNWQDAEAASFTLTAATSSTLGGVIVPLSSDIQVDSSGNLTLGGISANKITNGVLPGARFGDGNIEIGTTADSGISTNNSVAIGKDSTATGSNSTSVGGGSTASNVSSSAIGSNATASGSGSMAVGRFAQATNTATTAVGSDAEAAGSTSTAIGWNSDAIGTRSIAIGAQSDALESFDTVIGTFSEASGGSSTAIGFNSTASGSGSLTVGSNTTASGAQSTAIGQGTNTAIDKQVKIGADNTYHTLMLGGARIGADLTAHLLDDYEEGTWTCSDTNVTGEQFVKVGRNVTLYGTTTAAVTSATGLPFVPSIGAIGGNASVTTTAISIPATGVFTITYRTAS